MALRVTCKNDEISCFQVNLDNYLGLENFIYPAVAFDFIIHCNRRGNTSEWTLRSDVLELLSISGNFGDWIIYMHENYFLIRQTEFARDFELKSHAK